MSCANHLADEIRKRGYRVTPQRLAVLHVLQSSGGHLSAGDVFEQVQGALAGVTEATIYRTLEFLSENGFVRATHAGRGRLEYEISGSDHHHLRCRVCGYEQALPHQQLIFLYAELERQTGFRLTDSHITFLGVCPHCKN